MLNTTRNFLKQSSKRSYTTSSAKYVLEHLKERCLIRVVGAEVSEFLQGLITNDIKHLENGPGSMYTMFLNTKGRVTHDSIIYRTEEDNSYLIECDLDGVEALQRQLKLYRVRRKIDIIGLQKEYKIHALFNVNNANVGSSLTYNVNSELVVPCDKLNATLPSTSSKFHRDLSIFRDPRINLLGSRVISKIDVDVKEQIKDLVEVDDSSKDYRWFRYNLGVGEGTSDLPTGNCFPLEANCDYLHGVSFHKGCYIGQELTARTYHTGVIRKRLMPLHFTTVPSKIPDEPTIVHENDNLGKFRGLHGNVGLALLRISKALNYGEIKVGDGVAKVLRPSWWPVEVSKEKMSLQKS
ncbi:unnamed protein product [Brassicogethes aeneus]|uniref:Transferase CAF17 homolog, mitochondrial n=1 Tax=Brassicogethes aeneus TaxID=1431903 RepID=A0A9P0AUY0_BRAAE|nr:unnamed protein product [Brassicogethes aeneus]